MTEKDIGEEVGAAVGASHMSEWGEYETSGAVGAGAAHKSEVPDTDGVGSVQSTGLGVVRAGSAPLP